MKLILPRLRILYFTLVTILGACAPVDEGTTSIDQAMLPDFRNPIPVATTLRPEIFLPTTCTLALWRAGGCHMVVATPFRNPREGRFIQRFLGIGSDGELMSPTTGLVQTGRTNIDASTSVTTMRFDMAIMHETWRRTCETETGRVIPTCVVYFGYDDTAATREYLVISIGADPDSVDFPEVLASFRDYDGGEDRPAEVYAVAAGQPTASGRTMTTADVDPLAGPTLQPNPFGNIFRSRFPAWRAD